MNYSYLALGDSYTIGEQVPLFENFPYQAIQILRKQFIGTHNFFAPEILAKTGWTTDELLNQIHQTEFQKKYDFVSLLIGVNNQYRGKELSIFATEFEILLKKANAFADGNTAAVFVLSIPDWGVTPFAADRDLKKISNEINQYNEVCKDICLQSGSHFIDITTSQRIDGTKDEFLASDKLHPSGLEYAKWAALLSEKLIQLLK